MYFRNKISNMLHTTNSPLNLKKKSPEQEDKKTSVTSQPISGTVSHIPVANTQTSLSTSEAATELFQLHSKISTTPEEQWRTLDIRDRILRGWGGAGSRVHVGGATVGTCCDMCPEKELLQRRAEHQVMTLETVVDSDWELDPRRAVKQYSRSSADQEIPMCYELRPASVLMRTCAYLLHEIADTDRPVSLADWFHFMWDRLRSIRKDITQQALCCAESIRLVETCARFHAHCTARLADLEHTQFDQRLNTDNLTKCLQTLKHMYADVTPEHKPRESEFRGYVALLNLGDANFWWEIKQLPIEIQKSKDIIFAIKIFNALDNNNYVRFFRLIQDEATYLQACILLRYFNDVRARALARIVKAYAPRGGSRYPAEDMMRALAFESLESLNSFINHYGLRFSSSDDVELSIILDRNQFIEDSDPYPIARAISLIESKRNSSVGEIIAGGKLPQYKEQVIFTSFTKDGKLKESALTAEDQGYNTTNDSNKDINSLKAEIQKLYQGGKIHGNIERPTEDKVLESKRSLFVKNMPKLPFAIPASDETDSFSFTPALVVAPTEIIKNTSEKILKDAKSVFSFSLPQETVEGNLFVKGLSKSIFETKVATDAKNIFGTISNNNQSPHTHFLCGNLKPDENLFKKPEVKSVFGQPCEKPTSVLGVAQNKNIFANRNENTNIQTSTGGKYIFGAKSDSLFFRNTVTFEKGNNIFGKPIAKSNSDDAKRPSNIFGTFGRTSITNNLFSKSGTIARQITPQSIFSNCGTAPNKLSPSALFKSAAIALSGADSKSYSIFHSKNKAQTVADIILNSVNSQSASVYEFNQNADTQKESLLERLKDERMKEEKRMIQEKIKREEQERREELRHKEEARKKEEEMKILEERRKKEEQKKQEELKKKVEKARKAELKRKAEEEKIFKERVNKESDELIEELVNELGEETAIDLIKEELERFKNLMNYGNYITDNILEDTCNEICELEMKAEKFRTEKLLRKWFHVWRKQYITNKKKRNLLKDTPVWLTEKTPLEEANYMRRAVENFALKNMNAIHRGYKFIGELKQLPAPNPYNIMEIIRSPLLKRMKQINYPYDKCFFWKVTLISPGSTKWLYKKINIEKWLLDAFGDKNDHEVSKTLIHVGKQSWNHLMDFAISVSLASEDKPHDHAESTEGTNGVLFYMIDNDVTKTIEDILKHKYPYQVIPVAVLIPNTDINAKIRTECLLRELVEKNLISTFKIFIVNSENVSESLNASTKRAMKWIAKNYPQVPPLEIDYLKSICQRYLGNEIWCMLRSNRDERISKSLKDLHKLIKCYNVAVDKLTVVITNERLFNYASFPLEFQKYLDSTSPYPKPYEFIPSNVKNSENISAIKHIMERLKLPDPSSEFNSIIAVNMQQQMRIYCNQIGWLDDPENVVSKVISVIPKESLDLSMPREDFSKYLAHYDLIDFLNIVVYEMINKLNNFDNRLAIYQKSVLADYRNMPWLYEISAINEMKHKETDHKDAIDFYIESKRRKIEIKSLEYLMLEDKDFKLVDECIQEIDGSISKYNDCAEVVKQLELKLEEGKKKSLEFENLLKTALADY